jgi:hypothetical protein
MLRRHHGGMIDPALWADPELRPEERAFRRRRLLAAVVTLTAFVAVAGGSVVGAVASAHEDRADTGSQIVVLSR